MLKWRVAGAPAAGVREVPRPVDFTVGLDQHLRQRHNRQARYDAVTLDQDCGVDHFGGERAQVQVAGVIDADRPVRVG